MFAVTRPSLLKSTDPKFFFRKNLQKIMEDLLIKLQKISLHNVLLSFEKLTVSRFINLLVVFLFRSIDGLTS